MSELQIGLYRKIHAVMKDVDYLQKDDSIEFAKTKYKAISEEKVTMAVRKALLEHGLVILPIDQEHTKEGNLSTVNTRYKIIDIDTGQYETIASSGTGADTQDKGVGKAMTYAYKYLLLRTFAIPTGEDPDKTSSAELDEKAKGNNQASSNNDPISSKQVGMVKSLVKELALHGKVEDKIIYDSLAKKLQTQINDVTHLSKQQASKAITVLNGWKKDKIEKQGA